MDSKLKIILAELRKMTSSQAADWLMENYPTNEEDYWVGIKLLSHVSWKRSDQIRLATFYLKKMPFANSTVYATFASIMAFDLLIKIIREQLPTDKNDINLLLYHLEPILQKFAKKESDQHLMNSFIAELKKI